MGINRIATGGSDGFGPQEDPTGPGAGHGHAEGGRHADGADVSTLARALAALLQLQRDDPARFRRAMEAVAEALRGAAPTADGPEARRLLRLAGRFEEDGRAGALSAALLLEDAGAAEAHPPLGVQAYQARAAGPARPPALDLARAIQGALRRAQR